MKNLVVAHVVAASGLLLLSGIASGHGGTYRGPGDTVPPGGSGGGGGGRGPIGPGSGAPAAPGVGGPASPVGPAGRVSVAGRSVGPTTGGASAGSDLTAWDFWWEFNKDPYLDLKAHIHQDATSTGYDTWFIGHGARPEARSTLRPSEHQIRTEVVPALKHALANESSNDIVTGALVALAKIGDERREDGTSEFEQLFVPFLRDGNQEVRETAAVALGILANDSSVPLLTALLRDTRVGRQHVGKAEVSFRTRSFAAYGLGLIGARTADQPLRSDIVATFVDVLNSDVARDRDIKAACLISLGLTPLEEPPTAARPGDSAAEAHTAAPHESRVGQIEFALAFLDRDSESTLVRAHAPSALARLLEPRDDAALPPALHALYKERIANALMQRLARGSTASNEEVQSAVAALGLLGDNDADEVDVAIRKHLLAVQRNFSDQQSRNFAQIALGRVGGRMGRGADTAAGMREVQRALLTTLGAGKSALRPWAALGIGVFCDTLREHGAAVAPDVVRSLRSALANEKNPDWIGAYAIAAGLASDIECSPVLLAKLDTVRPNGARGYCALGLGLLGERSAIDPIQRVVAESTYRPELLRQAAIALGLLGDKQAVDGLLAMLRDARSLATQASVSSALGFIGDRRSIPKLVDMLSDQSLTGAARGLAAAALGTVADKEPLPWNSRIGVGLNYRASAETLNDPAGTGILNIL